MNEFKKTIEDIENEFSKLSVKDKIYRKLEQWRYVQDNECPPHNKTYVFGAIDMLGVVLLWMGEPMDKIYAMRSKKEESE